MPDYTWVPWFKELAAKIADGGEDYLIEQAKAVEWRDRRDDPSLLRYGDENIDPFSFLYFLAQKNTSMLYQPVFGSVHQVFGIEATFPDGPVYIPRSPFNVLFHDGEHFYPELLWRLFRKAATEEVPAIDAEDFEVVLGIRNVGMRKLTQTLFIANPDHFLPNDRILEGIFALMLPQFENNGTNYEDYVARMEAVKDLFPGCKPYEINTFLDTWIRRPLITNETDFFQISTNVRNDGTDYWEMTDRFEDDWPFKENNYVYTGESGGDIRQYPLTDPKRGDLILVRFGLQGHAIGVVEENGYAPNGFDENGVISVYWINKTTAPIERGPQIGFSRAGESTRAAFRNTDAYRVSFGLIDRLMGGGQDSSGPEDDPANEDGNGFSLNTILFGPPGTGKTWETTSLAVAIVDGREPEELADAEPEERANIRERYAELVEAKQIRFVTFHQSYAYEDFIEGIRPRLEDGNLAYELHDGIFKRISSRACKHPNERHVLIIDEINRGNIARIFGELITLIEPSRRLGREDETRVVLPCSGKRFGVPPNLWTVGTMNTADRGIALLDAALRRRFDFIEKMPDASRVAEDIEGVDGRAMLEAVNERITVYLDREHQIGHTYLMDVTTIDGLAEAFQHRIMPLLAEYFYDDRAKIREVLNRNPFIGERRVAVGGERERPVFDVLPHDDDGWRQAYSYQRIYSPEQGDGGD